jgi:hypothetical protein
MLSERQLAKRVRGWRRAPLRTPPHPARCSQSSQLTTFSREGRGKAPSPITRHSLDIRHCLCYERHYLAHSRDAVARHTRLRSKGGCPRADLQSALGRLWGTTWPAKGPVCEELAGQAEAGKTPAQPRPRKRGSGAEPDVVATALASAAVERRKASAPRIWRASAPVSADNGWMRLSALRFPRAFPRDANEL